MDILLGIVNAIVGGWLFNTFDMQGVSGVNLYSMAVASTGAAVVLIVYHAFFRGSLAALVTAHGPAESTC